MERGELSSSRAGQGERGQSVPKSARSRPVEASATSQVPAHSVQIGERSKGEKSKRGSSRSPIQVESSPPLRQASRSNEKLDVPPPHPSGHPPIKYVGNLRSVGPENSDVRMEFVRTVPPVNTLDTSQQSLSGIRRNAGANLSGPFGSSTPGPSPHRVGTAVGRVQPMPSYVPCSSSTPGPSPGRVGPTEAIEQPQSRHLPCAVPPTRSVSAAPVDPAPVLPPGEGNDGAGPSGSSEAGSAKKKKKNKIGGAIVTVRCPDCNALSSSQSEHYNHFRVLVSNVIF